MTVRLRLVLLLPLSGCVIGAGSSHVGQWAEHDEVMHQICVQSATSTCERKVEVTEHEPARSFVGFTFLVSPSVVQVHEDNADRIGARGEFGVEYLRGHGRFGYSLRAAFMAEGSSVGSRRFVPLTAFGHMSVGERLTLRLGLGYVPYSDFRSDGSELRTTSSIVRGVFGSSFVLMQRREVYFTLNTELDTLLQMSPFAQYRSTGLSFALAIHF